MTESEQPSPADLELIEMLQSRDGLPSSVHLASGEVYTVWNIAWGYDMSDAYAHVITNVSPAVDGTPIDVFSTEDIDEVTDPADGSSLWQRP